MTKRTDEQRALDLAVKAKELDLGPAEITIGKVTIRLGATSEGAPELTWSK